MIDLDAYIDGTPPSRLKRKKFYVVRIGNKTTEQSPNKIEEQKGQDGQLIATPPTIERDRNQNTIISKNSGAIYMELFGKKRYGGQGFNWRS